MFRVTSASHSPPGTPLEKLTLWTINWTLYWISIWIVGFKAEKAYINLITSAKFYFSTDNLGKIHTWNREYSTSCATLILLFITLALISKVAQCKLSSEKSKSSFKFLCRGFRWWATWHAQQTDDLWQHWINVLDSNIPVLDEIDSHIQCCSVGFGRRWGGNVVVVLGISKRKAWPRIHYLWRV